MSRHWPAVLPSRNFAALLFVLGSIWYLASNQNNAPVYLVLFVLVSVLLVSIPHTLMNLHGVEARAESIKPTFAGQEVSVQIEITNRSRVARHGIALSLPRLKPAPERVDEIAKDSATRLAVRFPAPKRGEHRLESIRLTTIYPLGFFQAARLVVCDQSYLVYPRPAGDPRLPGSFSLNQGNAAQSIGDGDDFAGARPYVPGESQRRIDWKAVARGQALMTKQFTTEIGGSAIYFDLQQLPSADLEQRLSQLALWVIEAERARRPYGLRLPGNEIAASLGPAHFHLCQCALAVFK